MNRAHAFRIVVLLFVVVTVGVFLYAPDRRVYFFRKTLNITEGRQSAVGSDPTWEIGANGQSENMSLYLRAL
jgi:hypothetical protein